MDLAKEVEFELGGLRIRPALRQVDSQGESQTLEPRIMQVLVALTRRRGDVVSRDQLIEECWDGLAVGEDSISRCIYRLRKLGESTGAFSLETITRVGYRLMEIAQPVAAATLAIEEPLSAASQLGSSSVPVKPKLDRRLSWIGGGIAAAALLTTAIAWPRQPSLPIDSASIDALVGRLADSASTAESQRQAAGEAIRTLSTGRSEERSAFAALASGDGKHALDLLDELARGLEDDGQTKAAADVYARIGAIALVVDQPRGLVARQRAFSLTPESLNAFQGLFFDFMSSGNTPAQHQLINETLTRPNLTKRMRVWVLAHRGLLSVDSLASDMESVHATLREMEELGADSDDRLIELSIKWLRSLIAFNQDQLGLAVERASEVATIWRELPEHDRIQNVAEIGLLRMQFASGDWTGTFERGAEMLDLRGRKGEFLPTPVIIATCMSGVYSNQPGAAEPYCAIMAERLEVTGGIMPKVYGSLLKAAQGDERGARSDLDAAKVMLGPRSMNGYTLAPNVLMAEAYFARQRGDLDGAREFAKRAVRQVEGPPGRQTWRSFSANANQLIGEWMIAGGRPADACGPLAEAKAHYAEIGAATGVTATDALSRAAGCSAR